MCSTVGSSGVVPSGTEPDISEIIRIHRLTGTPVLVPVSPCQNYQREQCHISAKHAELTNRGRRVHGWAFWTFNQGTEDEITLAYYHSVLEDNDGVMIDVTPTTWPANHVLFINDSNATIKHVGNDLVFPATITPLPGAPFLDIKGTFCNYSTWTKSINSNDITSYCLTLAIDPRQIAT
jgi:hypothetical protein